MRAKAFVKAWESGFSKNFESMGVVALGIGLRTAISCHNYATISGLHHNLAVNVHTDAA